MYKKNNTCCTRQKHTHIVTTRRYKYSVIMQQLTADWMSHASNLLLVTLHNMSASIMPCNYTFSSRHYLKWLILMFSKLYQVSNCAYIQQSLLPYFTLNKHKNSAKDMTEIPFYLSFYFRDSAFNSIQNCKINLRKNLIYKVYNKFGTWISIEIISIKKREKVNKCTVNLSNKSCLSFSPSWT